MWQGDTFQFRIRGVGKVYVTGFTDDFSRYRVKSKVYLHKDAASAVNAMQWALRAGRIPREIYVDNGKQFVSKAFKAEAQKPGIKLIFGKPYYPSGRGKIERYHQTLYRGTYRSQGISFTQPFQERTLDSITCTTTGASRKSWSGKLQPQSSTTKSISIKTENVYQADKNSVNKTDIICGTLQLK